MRIYKLTQHPSHLYTKSKIWQEILDSQRRKTRHIIGVKAAEKVQRFFRRLSQLIIWQEMRSRYRVGKINFPAVIMSTMRHVFAILQMIPFKSYNRFFATLRMTNRFWQFLKSEILKSNIQNPKS